MPLRDDELESLLRSARNDQFAPGFTNRVLQRTLMIHERALGAVLQRYFAWMVPAAITAIALLAIHNARTSNTRGLDALLALQPVTLNAAYTLDAGSPVP